MKRVTYKQRGDESFMIEIKSQPSAARDFRNAMKNRSWFFNKFYPNQVDVNYRAFNSQEGEE